MLPPKAMHDDAEIANKAGEIGSVDLFTRLVQAHQKARWFLKEIARKEASGASTDVPGPAPGVPGAGPRSSPYRCFGRRCSPPTLEAGFAGNAGNGPLRDTVVPATLVSGSEAAKVGRFFERAAVNAS